MSTTQFFWQNPTASLQSNPRFPRRVVVRQGVDEWAVYEENEYENRYYIGTVTRASRNQFVATDNRSNYIEAPPPARGGYFETRAQAVRAIWERAPR